MKRGFQSSTLICAGKCTISAASTVKILFIVFILSKKNHGYRKTVDAAKRPMNKLAKFRDCSNVTMGPGSLTTIVRFHCILLSLKLKTPTYLDKALELGGTLMTVSYHH